VNGMWKGDIIYGLLWIVRQRSGPLMSDMHPTALATGPSWTWASHWSLPVSHTMRLSSRFILPMVEVDWSRRGACHTPKASHKERSTINTGRLDPYQNMTITKLVLTGYVSTGVVEHVRLPEGRGAWSRFITSAQDQDCLGTVYFDRDPAQARVKKVTLLLCTTCAGSIDQVREVSLALVSTGRNDEYRRVGLLALFAGDPLGARTNPYDAKRLVPPELWKGRTRRTIVLVWRESGVYWTRIFRPH
jgi:hypothetical protein